jgi:hypothetical protein
MNGFKLSKVYDNRSKAHQTGSFDSCFTKAQEIPIELRKKEHLRDMKALLNTQALGQDGNLTLSA